MNKTILRGNAAIGGYEYRVTHGNGVYNLQESADGVRYKTLVKVKEKAFEMLDERFEFWDLYGCKATKIRHAIILVKNDWLLGVPEDSRWCL